MVRNKRFAIPIFLNILLLGGCTNSLMGRLTDSLILPAPTTTSSTTPTDLFVISSVNINSSNSPTPVPSGTPSGGTPISNIFFDTTLSTAAVSSHCNVATSGQTSKPCLCQFSWAEVNPNSGSNVATSRNVQTTVTQVQPNLLSCNAPSVFTTEIISGTQIKITVIAAPGNPDSSSFTTRPFSYNKSPTTQTGSFQDAQGHIFDNVVHYSCYNKYVRGLSIQSKSYSFPNSKTGATIAALYGTSFCLTSGGVNGPVSSSGCPNLGAASNSAQSYYFNLYIRNSEKGDINKFNDNFVCPTVQEPLVPAPSVGGTGQFWPMDTTFALSLGATTDFSVGVQANTKLSGGGSDPTAATSQCFASSGTGSGTGGNTTSIVASCLGFAAHVTSDGTCPYIKSASGQILQTFRLRRFVALYPRLFDTDGKPSPKGQDIDTVYVLDRPIASSATINPLKPYTMMGPKPCPFAFFDKKNVTADKVGGLGPDATYLKTPLGYRGTNDPRWKTGDGTINWTQQWSRVGLPGDVDNNGGTNIDGIEFPNFDANDDIKGRSCSATMPFLSADGSHFYMATVNKYRTEAKFQHLYIRPFKPFTPHYEEDTTFLACAPQANPFKEAPLHFMPSPTSTGGTNYSWCAESYPTQNSNITSLDPAVTPIAPSNPTTPAADPNIGGHVALVSPFTSHISTLNGSVSSIGGTACSATTITFPSVSTYAYPAAGTDWAYARHDAGTTWGALPGGKASLTCDRTVTTSSDITWTQFPLLAPTADVERALASDSSYNCTVTYDNATGKAAARQTPAGGCCMLKSAPATKIVGATHLEPTQTTCLPPTY
ncbi:MAG: hypothetical protein ABI041_00150 [Bdellovibrionia bacterium]